MRTAAAFSVLGLALAAAASAGPIDDREGVKAEVEAAYASVQGGVAGAEGSAPAADRPHRDAAAQGGNPLWMIPLSALTATRERPLFSVSRRPPPTAVEAAAPPPRAPDPAPSAPALPERPALTLIGTIVSPSTSVAMLRDTATQAVTRLRDGEATSGWLLKTVKLRSVIIEKGDQSTTLELPKPLDTPGEQPPPNPLAFGDKRNRH
jgi:general secretion pathway protein N